MNDDLRNRRRANLQRLLNPRHIAFVGGRAGEEGAALQARLNEVAGDLALVGPNCLGVLNQFDGSAVWGGGNVVQSVRDTGVALISQSGYIAYSITNVEQAFPLGYAISIGNQAVLDVADFIDAMLRDKRVRAIGLYLEGIVDIAALSAAALCAVEIGIPLVVLKAGGTTEGADLAHSHSGTLAVDDEIWSALFRRLAMVEVGSPKALIETLKLLGASKPPQGKRIVATANSGAYAAMIAEKGKALGLAFPGPTDAQRDALRETVPDLVSLFNPLDWNLPWASMATPEISYAGMGILLDDRCDLLVYFVDWPRQKDVADVWWPTLEGLIRLNEQSDCPVVIASVLPDGLPAELRQRLAEAGREHAARARRCPDGDQRRSKLYRATRVYSGRFRKPPSATTRRWRPIGKTSERGRRQSLFSRIRCRCSRRRNRDPTGNYRKGRSSDLSAGRKTPQRRPCSQEPRRGRASECARCQ